jgi:hypothetical protein
MLNEEENPRMYASDFSFQNRFIGNYLSRHLVEGRFTSEDFNRIVIVGCQRELKPARVEEKALMIDVYFHKAAYDGLKKEDKPYFFYKMYLDGIGKAAGEYPFPHEFLTGALEELRAKDFRNEWVARAKLLREISVKAIVFCQMTMDIFSAVLVLQRKEETIYEEEILKTQPDELFFYDKFRDIVYENYEISVLNQLKGRVFYMGWPILNKGNEN